MPKISATMTTVAPRPSRSGFAPKVIPGTAHAATQSATPLMTV